jgi:hypothetical protein
MSGMEKQQKVRFLVGGGTIEEYLAYLEQRKSGKNDLPPEAGDDPPEADVTPSDDVDGSSGATP